jgi:hypothetical protein
MNQRGMNPPNVSLWLSIPVNHSYELVASVQMRGAAVKMIVGVSELRPSFR